ncbi:major facilitator superfamily domain-containing protein [Xylaria cf. heliscus]|nr:major facilitator superfamily domain-containing protein [Xylaria cf. heliscus]
MPDSADSQTPLLAPSSSSEVDTGQAHEGGTASEETCVDDDKARTIVYRIDTRIITLLFATAMVNFMDKTILSSASVFGLRKDTGLIDRGPDSGPGPGHGYGSEGKNKYAYVAAAFYVGYALSSYPAAALLSRLPVGKFLGGTLLLCGVTVAATALCRDFAGLVGCRFALGAFEAAVTPSLVFVTGTWYTRDEIPKRTGVWFAGHAVGGIAASGLAFLVGILVAEGEDRHAWRWMFAILGALTFVLGVVVLRFLPDGISTARFLRPGEKVWVRDRVVRAGMGSTSNAEWKWDQAREALSDPQTWMICAISLCCQIPNGGTQNFANLVLTALGFSPLGSTIINVPYSILCIGAISGSGWCAGRFRSMNCILIALVVIPPITGSALIVYRATLPPGVSLLAYFLLASGPAALPLLLSLVQANIRGVTKKNTTTALLFIAYCVGNIVGPQLFVEGEAPAYDTAFRGIVVCYSLVVGLVLVLRVYLNTVNRLRAIKEGLERSAGISSIVGGDNDGDIQEIRLRPEHYDDVTDWNTSGFRYRL